MSDIDDFIADVRGRDLRLRFSEERSPVPRPPERIDAIFQIPLLCLATLVVVYDRSSTVGALGRRVAELLAEHFVGLREHSEPLTWSIVLRRRTVEALVFLEASALVDVARDSGHTVTIAKKAKVQLSRTRRTDSGDAAQLVRGLFVSAARAVGRRGSA
jgi:hypothetical protein